jgi:hypothetical protein
VSRTSRVPGSWSVDIQRSGGLLDIHCKLFSSQETAHDETLTEKSLSVLQGMLLCNLAILSAT